MGSVSIIIIPCSFLFRLCLVWFGSFLFVGREMCLFDSTTQTNLYTDDNIMARKRQMGLEPKWDRE